jgi:hypothetical protein
VKITTSTAKRFIALCCAVVLLASCRVDTQVSMVVNPDGSGTVTVTIDVDKEIVERSPDIADNLDFSDLEKNGWQLTKPVDTASGGKQVVLARDFANESEATAVLAQLNGDRGPFREVILRRGGKARDSSWNLSGRLEVTGGLQAFADDQLIAALGATPYENIVKSQNLDLGKALTIEFVASLPGELKSSTAIPENGMLSWRVATDGTPVDLATSTENVDVVGTLGGIVSKVGLFLLISWIGLMAVLGILLYKRQYDRQRKRTSRSQN